MNQDSAITIRIDRRHLIVFAIVLFAAAAVFVPSKTLGQAVQKDYKEKFNIADNTGGIGVATSADGKFVYVAGPQGILVSDDFGKTGSWVETVRLK